MLLVTNFKMRTRSFFKIGLVLLLTVVLILFINFISQPKTQLIKAYFNEKYDRKFTIGYFVKFENRDYLIKEIYKYQNGILKQKMYIAGSEGYATKTFGIIDIDNLYNNEEKQFRFLNINIEDDFVEFKSSKHKISARRGDTIICKLDNKSILLFLTSKNK